MVYYEVDLAPEASRYISAVSVLCVLVYVAMHSCTLQDHLVLPLTQQKIPSSASNRATCFGFAGIIVLAFLTVHSMTCPAHT